MHFIHVMLLNRSDLPYISTTSHSFPDLVFLLFDVLIQLFY